MLVDLVAFGMIAVSGSSVDPGTGTVVVPEGAMVLIDDTAAGNSVGGLPIGAFPWARPFDPSDRAPYAFDWSRLLDDGETIAEIVSMTISALGASLGVMVDTDPDRVPVIDGDHKRVGLWFIVAPDSQADPAFSAAGTKVGLSMLIRTTASPYREYERTAILTVRQQ